MGYLQMLLFYLKSKHLILSLFFLLILILAHKTSFAEGRAMLDPAEILRGREEKLRERWYLIGSRPPKCERRCSSCAHCEAIQVPIVPQQKLVKPRYTLNSRGDNLANYKPVSWKCKCGNLIFNP